MAKPSSERLPAPQIEALVELGLNPKKIYWHNT